MGKFKAWLRDHFNKVHHFCTEVWRSRRFGWALIVGFLGLLVYWHFHIPSPGKAVAALAVAAAVMTFRGDISGLEKFCWMLVLFAFLYVELRAIDKDRQEAARQQACILAEGRASFAQVLEQQQHGFEQTLGQQQLGFKTTLSTLLDSRSAERTQFTSVLRQGESVFKHQQELAESLTEKLIPGTKSTPTNGCGKIQPGEFLVLVGDDQAFVTSEFPHTILQINDQKFFQIDRTPDGALDIIADIRGQDNRIIARLSRRGIIVNEANKLQVVKTPHSIIIEDTYGNEVLNVEYLNKQTIKIKGLLFYKETLIDLSNPAAATGNRVTFSCSRNAGTDLEFTLGGR